MPGQNSLAAPAPYTRHGDTLRSVNSTAGPPNRPAAAQPPDMSPQRFLAPTNPAAPSPYGRYLAQQGLPMGDATGPGGQPIAGPGFVPPQQFAPGQQVAVTEDNSFVPTSYYTGGQPDPLAVLLAAWLNAHFPSGM